MPTEIFSTYSFSARNTPADISDLPEKAIRAASDLLRASREHETSQERENSAKMARMMADPAGKKFTIAMADQVLRMQKPRRSAGGLRNLLREYGLPKYLTCWIELFCGLEIALLKLYRGLSCRWSKIGSAPILRM